MSVSVPLSLSFSREKLLQVARTLPADLHVLSHLGEVLQDPNTELYEIAELLRRDLPLAARIVRISNSAAFGGEKIGSVEEAVNRVGFSEILKLVGTATAARLSDQALACYGVGAEALRGNILFGAFAAEALARSAGMDPRVAYSAGLLRTLGLMVLNRASREQLKTDLHYSGGRWPTFSAWESSVFETSNGEVSALVLEEWRFPREIAHAVRGHYLARSADWDSPLAVLLNLANGVAHRRGYSLAGETNWWDVSEEKLRVAGLAAGDLDKAAVHAGHAFESALTNLAA